MNEPYNLISPCNMNLDKKKKHFILFFKKREKKLLTCIDPALVFLFSKGMLHFSLLAAKLAVYQSTFAHYQHH